MRTEKMRETAVSEEIATICARLDKNEQLFNMAENDDLIDAVIYERKALLARYSHLVKEAKRLGITADIMKKL